MDFISLAKPSNLKKLAKFELLTAVLPSLLALALTACNGGRMPPSQIKLPTNGSVTKKQEATPTPVPRQQPSTNKAR